MISEKKDLCDLCNLNSIYYYGKEVKITWECVDFNMVEVLFCETGQTIIIEKDALSSSPTVGPYITINLRTKEGK